MKAPRASALTIVDASASISWCIPCAHRAGVALVHAVTCLDALPSYHHAALAVSCASASCYRYLAGEKRKENERVDLIGATRLLASALASSPGAPSTGPYHSLSRLRTCYTSPSDFPHGRSCDNKSAL